MLLPEERIEKHIEEWLQERETPARSRDALKTAWKAYRSGELDKKLEEPLLIAIDYMIDRL